VPQAELRSQSLVRFLGVNLRTDGLNAADEDVRRAINADLHSELGSAMLRLGRTAQFSSALSDPIRRLAKFNAVRYQVAGTVAYRDETTIIQGLSTDHKTTIASFRPLLDSTTWTFFADGNKMQKDDGTNVRTWGVDAPSSKPTVQEISSGNLTGDYSARYTYVRKTSDEKIAYESAPSPLSNTLTLSSQNFSVTVIQSADPQINRIRLYRTVSGGSEYLFDHEVNNVSQTETLQKPDTELGAQVTIDAGKPPNAYGIQEHQGHIFFVGDADNPHYLWFSSRFLPENVPSGNFIELGDPTDPLQMMGTFSGQLGVLSQKTKYIITGNTASGFAPREAVSKRGTVSAMAVVGTELGILFPARDGLFLTRLFEPDQELSQSIQPLFFGETVNEFSPINFDVANTMSMALFKNRVYFAYPSGSNTTPDMLAVFSRDTKRWYFYEMNVRSLYVEDSDKVLSAGLTDGISYELESGSSDGGSDIEYEVETVDRAGQAVEDRKRRKLFFYIRPDIDTKSEDVTVAVLIDGTSQVSATVNGTRTRPIIKLPEKSSGFQWRVKVTYTGTKRITFYGVDMYYLPLQVV